MAFADNCTKGAEVKRFVAALVAAGAIGAAGLTAGCGTTTYTGACIVKLSDAQYSMVEKYIRQPGNPAKAFIEKGKALSVCYAEFDPEERNARGKLVDAKSTDLEFTPAPWDDVYAAIAGYAAAGRPNVGSVTDLERVTLVAVLEVRNGRSYFDWKTTGQDRRMHDVAVELEGGLPSTVTFRLPS